MRLYVGVVTNAWSGRHQQALDQLSQAAAKNTADAAWLYRAACASSLASIPSESLDAQTAQLFRQRALKLLAAAIEAGYQDARQLLSDVDFAPLHEDERFRELVGTISRYAGLWRPGTAFESRLLVERTAEQHLEQCHQLIRQGFRPVSVAVLPDRSATASSTASVWHRPLIPDEDKEQLAIRQAHAAVTLLRLGQNEAIWRLLGQRPDPRLRSYILHQLSWWEENSGILRDRLGQETDASTRRMLVLAIGDQARRNQLNELDRATLTSQLLELYREDPDPGIHGGSEWALKQLGQTEALAQIRAELATGKVVADRNWYVSRTGDHTLVVFQPREPFLMGSPVAEAERYGGPSGRNEVRHRRQIPRKFAVATHEVSVAQFQEFLDNHQFNREAAREENAPANMVTWYESPQFCNWLSKQEGIPRDQWCYDPEQSFSNGMMLYPDYLARAGYRLPTEAEWEYACRAGATTARYFGETATLLGEYARYDSRDRWMLPVGSLKPNDFGLFDMLGNANEWCQDTAQEYLTDRSLIVDQEEAKLREDSRLGSVWNANRYILRGGSFNGFASFARSAYRHPYPPTFRSSSYGFRLARTLPP